jgi:tRNA pseudouridine38-40 synthase
MRLAFGILRGYINASNQMSEIQRYKLVVSYRGTAYFGWQTQGFPASWKGARPAHATGLPTVQTTMNNAVKEVLRHPVKCVGSSRTDTGVHAKGQVVHFDTHLTQIPMIGLMRAINHQLPDDILIRSIEPVPPTFDAIASAASKRYQYAVWNHDDRPVFQGDLYYHRWQPIHIEPMREAMQHLIGTHDFAAFAKPGHKRLTTVRTVTSIDVSRRGPIIVIGFEGGGFLWNQVRIMAGTLIDVGEGLLKPDDVAKMLDSRDRRRAGRTAPANGLYLQWVKSREGSAPNDANEITSEAE